MKVLIFSQYFWPETAAKIIEEAYGLRQAGHQVEVLTSFPCYPAGKIYPGYRQRLFCREEINGVTVIRVPQYPDHSKSPLRRILNYVSFAVSAVCLGLWRIRRADVMLVYQSAIPTGIAAWVIGRLRGIPYVLDVVDLWPDSVIASDMLKNKWLLAMVGYVSGFVYRRADHVNAITEGYRQRLLEMGVAAERVSVIHHWIRQKPTDVKIADLEPKLLERFRGRVNILYTGNLGPLQSLEVVIDAAELLAVSHPDVQFVLIGDGLESSKLQAELRRRGLSNVWMPGHRPAREMHVYCEMADALLVHLRPSALADISIPSKLISYLQSARPILMGLSGEAVQLVEQYECGICFEPMNGRSLAEAVIRLVSASPEQRRAWQAGSLRAFRQHFEPNAQLAKMTDLLRDVNIRRAA